jgi:hypothetical protein
VRVESFDEPRQYILDEGDGGGDYVALGKGGRINK